MSKGRCPSRAEWRFELGKPAKQLSPHYVLDCDYGTAIIACWETGGSEPVYLCASHSEELRHRAENRADGRRSPGNADSACGKAKPKAEPIPDDEVQSTAGEHPDVVSAVDKTKPADESEPAKVSLTPEAPVASPNQPIKAEETTSKPTGSSPEHFKQSSVDPVPPPGEISAAKPDQRAKTNGSRASEPPPAAFKETSPPMLVSKAARTAKDPGPRPAGRDLTFGNPSKAIVDEAIWNLPTGDHEAFRAALQKGKPPLEAAHAAGGQLAAIHRRVMEYSLKIDAVLAASAKTISVQDAVDKPLEQAMLEVIENDSMSDFDKDMVIQQLGALQEWAKSGVRTQFTPLEANRGLLAIGERVNWGGANEIPEPLKPAYRSLFASLKKAIHVSVPDAQELHDRTVNLHAAKSELLAAPTLELLAR